MGRVVAREDQKGLTGASEVNGGWVPIGIGFNCRYYFSNIVESEKVYLDVRHALD